jgi:hypothetical protein
MRPGSKLACAANSTLLLQRTSVMHFIIWPATRVWWLTFTSRTSQVTYILGQNKGACHVSCRVSVTAFGKIALTTIRRAQPSVAGPRAPPKHLHVVPHISCRPGSKLTAYLLMRRNDRVPYLVHLLKQAAFRGDVVMQLLQCSECLQSRVDMKSRGKLQCNYGCQPSGSLVLTSNA